MHQPVFSIITIVYNAETEIVPTVKSIIQQTYSKIEYIIIDGNSSDRTLEAIRPFKDKIAKIVSEPDKGLYDAMNKGIAHATGNYIWFINAGDELANNDVVASVAKKLDTLPDIIYGETTMIDQSGRTLGPRRLKAPQVLNWQSLQWGMVVCHQSFIVAKEKCLNYDLSIKIAADIDWMINVLKSAESIFNSGMVLSKFKTGGKSYKNIPRGLRERFKIMQSNFGFWLTVKNHFVLGARFLSYVLRNGRW
ncbi:MAG: hypothetical protein RIQ89_634 [Bacteroidota bacterium]|jgi:glycosyltransferase involved in cell wall biosynthesis